MPWMLHTLKSSLAAQSMSSQLSLANTSTRVFGWAWSRFWIRHSCCAMDRKTVPIFCLHRCVHSHSATTMELSLWHGMRNTTRQMYKFEMQLQNKKAGRLWNKVSRWHYRTGITIVAKCARSEKKVDRNGLSVHCVSPKLSVRALKTLYRPNWSSCRERLTCLSRLHACTTHFCMWWKRSWTTGAFQLQ